MTKCDFCGEKEATTEIINPNYDDNSMWNVCDYCEKFISEKQKEAFEHVINKISQNSNSLKTNEE